MSTGWEAYVESDEIGPDALAWAHANEDLLIEAFIDSDQCRKDFDRWVADQIDDAAERRAELRLLQS